MTQTWPFRGSKSRNKVSVGEPAEGSLNVSTYTPLCEPQKVETYTLVSIGLCLILLVCLYRLFFLQPFHPFYLLSDYSLCLTATNENNNQNTTLSDGYLGSHTDEERSEMRYVMRIAEFSESSNLWTQIAVLGNASDHASLSIGFISTRQRAEIEFHESDFVLLQEIEI